MANQSLGHATNYAKLRDEVRRTLLLGQKRIEQEKVRTYWDTGRLIHAHLLHHKKRAEFGERVIEKLSADLGVNDRLLQRCLKFYREFPRIPATWPELTWSHYRTLLGVSDKERRFALANRAVHQEWGTRELGVAVKRVNQANGRKPGPPELLKPLKGSLYTYRLIRPEKIHPGKPELRIDLGFSCQKDALMKGAESLKGGDIAVSEWVEGDTYRLKKAAGKTGADLFTFYAYVERVVDADTVIAQVDLGFGCWTRQYLRLRGIDAPELDTSAGQRAKQFVESELAGVPFVTIRSTRSDKYDRYLADVFYETKSGGQFLNNRLLESRLAWRV